MCFSGLLGAQILREVVWVQAMKGQQAATPYEGFGYESNFLQIT